MTPEEEAAFQALAGAVALIEALYPPEGGDRVAAVVGAILGALAQRYGARPTHEALVTLANQPEFWFTQDQIATALQGVGP